MMYIHYCSHCNNLQMLSGHKPLCPACGGNLYELSISFTQYSELTIRQRELLLQHYSSFLRI